MKLTYVDRSKDKKQKGRPKEKIWSLHLTYKEGIAMVASIMNQIEHENPNYQRLESYTEDGTYVSISVELDETELNLRNEIINLKDQLYNRSLRSWSIVPKERKKSYQKGAKNGKP